MLLSLINIRRHGRSPETSLATTRVRPPFGHLAAPWEGYLDLHKLHLPPRGLTRSAEPVIQCSSVKSLE